MADNIFFAEVFSFDDDVGHDCFLNQICKGFFHLPETGYAQPEEEGNDGEAEQEAGQVNGAIAAEDAPAETVDHPHHGIEAVKQSPLFRDDLAAESHRRNIKTELHHKRDDIAEIPVFHIERRNPETGSQTGQQGQDDEERQQQNLPAGCELIIDHHSDQDNETDEEIDESGYQGCRGNDQSGEVNFADQIGVADQTVGRFAQCV